MRFADIREQCLRDLGYHFSNPTTQFGPSVDNRINNAYLGLAGKANWSWWLGKLVVPVSTGMTRLSLPRRFTAVFEIRDTDGRLVQTQATTTMLKYQAWEDYSVTVGEAMQFTHYEAGTISLAQGSAQATLTGGVFPSDVVGRALTFPLEPEEYIITGRVDDTTVNLHQARVGAALADSAYAIDKAGTQTLELNWPGNASETWNIWYFWRPPRLVADDDEPLMPEEFQHYLVAAPRDQLLQGQRERQGLTQMAKLESEIILDDMRQRNATLLSGLKQEISVHA